MLLKKIVVAEDDDAIAHLVNMSLGDAGFLCLRARDGAEAINLVRVHAPDLLVLDVMMPRVSGHEVARKIKGDVILSRTPILMLTALSSVNDKVDGFDAGADDYLVKPFDLRELSARVHALIRASRRERDRNPTTNLPGSGAMEDFIAGVFKDNRDSAVVHVDVGGFDSYADMVGYTKAESLVAALGQEVLEAGRAREAGFVGHIGGVDFIVVCPREQAEKLAVDLVGAFDEKRSAWAPESGGAGEAGAKLTLNAAVVATRGIASDSELSQRLAKTMRVSKQREGSTYVVWGPELV